MSTSSSLSYPNFFKFVAFLSVFLTFSSFFCVTNAADDEHVVTLTESNFEEAISSNPFILVEFYAPWCGHCKKLAPEYEKAAKSLKDFEPKVVLAKVDATVEDSLAKQFNVRGFPTLKWFVNGKPMEYSGGRDEKTIVSWVQKKTGPAATTLKSADDLKNFKAKSDAVVVGFFENEGDQQAKTFMSLAAEDDETSYAICTGDKECKCADLDDGLSCGTLPQIVVYQNFDEGKAVYEDAKDLGDDSKEDLQKFVSGNVLPTIVQFSQKLAPKIFGGPVRHHLLIFVADESQEKLVKEEVSPVAKVRKGEALFVTVPKTESRIVEFFGVKEDEMPTIRMVHMSEGGVRKFKFTEAEIKEDTVTKFVQAYFDGTIPMDLKSEEIVPENQQGPVRVVVGKDFDQIVSNKAKNVLLEFYAPWCGHCKKLEPEYLKVAEYFKDQPDIVIAKMDATANEVEKVQITGFPTIKFFPAGSDEMVDYDGPRDKDGIIKWVEKHAVKTNGDGSVNAQAEE